MSTNRILTAMRNDLEAAGLWRRPSAAGILPPVFIEPRAGPPAPGDQAAGAGAGELVVTLRLSGQMAEAQPVSYRRRVVVDVIYRSIGTGGLRAGRDLDDAIRARLVERDDPLGYTLDAGGDLPTFALDIQAWAGLGPLSDVAGVRTDLAKYLIEAFA